MTVSSSCMLCCIMSGRCAMVRKSVLMVAKASPSSLGSSMFNGGIRDICYPFGKSVLSRRFYCRTKTPERLLASNLSGVFVRQYLYFIAHYDLRATCLSQLKQLCYNRRGFNV